MVGAPKPRAATYDDLLALPDHVVGEIIDGELYVQPRPASRHARAATILTGKLGAAFDYGQERPGEWIILIEPELHLGATPDVLSPDLAGWRRRRMPELPDVAAFTLAPDWLCEVLSPSTTLKDKKKKMPIYAREGVGHLWLIDPSLETLEVYRLESGRWVFLGVHAKDDVVRVEPFDAVELALEPLWSR
jgi:Uma2 family endonuclease